MLRYTLLPLAIALAVAVPSGAEHCTTYSTSEPEVELFGTYYVDNDLCQPGCLYSVWIYCESNGIEGLQRGDEAVNDTCHWMIEPDGCHGL